MTRKRKTLDDLDADAPPAASVKHRQYQDVNPLAPWKQPSLVVAERFARSLWRPALGWIGVLLALVITVRIGLGLPVPAIDAMAAPIATVIVAMVSRTVEKLNGAAG